MIQVLGQDFVDQVEVTAAQRKRMSANLLAWLESAGKSQVRDLDIRIKEMQANIALLTARLTVRVQSGGVKVEPNQADLGTWTALNRGTTWLEACDNLEARLLSA